MNKQEIKLVMLLTCFVGLAFGALGAFIYLETHSHRPDPFTGDQAREMRIELLERIHINELKLRAIEKEHKYIFGEKS